ncbi:hypothetical protein [Aliiroseovarius crassostreae]|uniref:hypothetical protein n=1 Tax=Aliiroseovarius crassostreae TaxID=154981 RepID=UPI00220FA760|nr:hypothetical protein [Aliiroseovarius crassostreae]UWQ06672.1 hypothetical protein K3X22_15390 [Aliiroseovarius crassostreae]
MDGAAGMLRKFLSPAIEAMVAAPIILALGRLVYSVFKDNGSNAIISEVFEILPLIWIFVALFILPQMLARLFAEVGKGAGLLIVITTCIYLGLLAFLLMAALFDESGVFVSGDWKYLAVLMTASFIAAILVAYRYPI